MSAPKLWICALLVAAIGLPLTGTAAARTHAVQPTLTVVVLGGGRVTSKPAGISCPGRCTATFRAGTRVLLTATARRGTPFLRWGGSCNGARGCHVRMTALAAVAAQFARGRAPSPPTASKSAVEPGTYSLYNSSRTFFVAPGGKSLVNVAIGGVAIACTPAASSASSSDFIVLDRIPIRRDGSFVGKGSQTGVFAGVPATFTYSFNGRFAAATATQAATATGSYREDIVFRDNVTHRCTSNVQSWTAVKTGPIPPPASLVKPGKYSLYNSAKTFSVAAGGRSLVNIAIGGVYIYCSPTAKGGVAYDQIVIAQAAIGADGSFSGRATQNGVYAGAPAKFTYTFSGHFQGQSKSGATTAAGLLREDIVFTDAAGSHTCTSNLQPWVATD